MAQVQTQRKVVRAMTSSTVIDARPFGDLVSDLRIVGPTGKPVAKRA